MTKEEAIEFGNMWLQINEDYKDSRTYEFFQMAIKSLKQERILDKIKAEIGHLDNLNINYLSSGIITIDKNDVYKIIDKYKSESGNKCDK